MGGIDLLSSLIKVALVFGLLFLTMKGLARHQRRSGRGRLRVAGQPATALVEVLDQSRLGRASSVAAVRVGNRAFLLGITEEQVANLAELTDDIDLTEPEEDDIDRQSVFDHAVDILRSGTFRR